MKLLQALSVLRRLSYISIIALAPGACGGGDTSSGADGGIIATGRALVSGNVASSTLPGDLNNISVTLKERTTSTNAAGEFTLGDVPAGSQEISFRKGGQTASLALSIQSQSQTTLNNIHIGEETVTTDHVEVEEHTSPVENVEEEDEHNTPETENEEEEVEVEHDTEDSERHDDEEEDEHEEDEEDQEDPEDNEPEDDEK